MYKKIAFIGVAVLIAPLFSFAQTSNCPTFTPPTILQRGSRDAAPGGQVSQLQRFLVGQRLLTNDSVSGFFGPLTEGAVREFQVSKDLPETGKTDEDTRDFITGMCGGLMPVPSLTASPTILPPPPAVQSATLTWSADNAAECRLRGPNVSETSTGAATGDDRTTSTGVLTKTSVYTLTCENARGTASDFATVAISSGSPRASSCPNVTRLLARGDSGDDVLRLQMFLSGQGVLNIDNATRNFGPLTERALIQLQARHGLTQNGMTDGPTRALMNSLCTATPAPLSCALIAPNNAAPNSDIRLSWSSSRNPGSGILERGGPTPTTTVFTLANATLPEGSTVLTAPATAGTYTYELSVNKAGNTPPTARCSQQVIVGTGAVPSHVTLRAQPASVAEGSATNLTWSAQNATECRLSGPNISETSTGAARTTSTGALTTTSTYTLRCVNASGPASDFLTVIVRGEGTTAACPDITLNLSLGDRNAQVTALQRFLVQMRLLTSDSVSGFFGSVTQTALEQLQTTHGIAVTGTTDARTRALIEGLCHRSSVLPSVTIAASDPAASEASLAVGRYIIRRTGPTTQALAVTVATSGTATRYIDNTTSNPDYSLSGSGIAGGTRRVATIPAGSATTEILLTPRQDILVEGNETSILTLSTGSGYTVGSPSTATVTIADNEVSTGLPSVTITATDAAAAEATTPDIGTYTISRTGATTATLAVNIAAMSGTAVRTTDYTLSGGGIVNPAGTTVTIPAGSANVVVTLTPVDDAAVETGGETAILALSAGTGYTVGTPSTATVTIADNDASTSGVPPAVSSITPTSGPVDTTVAITGSGFTTTGNTVHFGVGGKLNVSSSLNGTSISYTIPSSVSICDLIGSTCRAAMMLVNPGAYSISVSNVNGESNTKTFTVGGTTVVVPPSISSINAPTTLKVGETGTWRVTVTSPPGNLNYSVVWGDGTPNAAAAAVAPQSSATTFTHSYASAGSYTPIFRVSNSGGFAQTTASVVVGPIVTITAPDNIATEASLTKGKYTIRRTGPITQLLRVTVTITGTADRGTDYALSGSGMSTGLTAIIPADSATTDIILTPKKDIVDELTQTAIITLDDSPDNPNYSLGTPRSATVRITDNDVQADASAIDEGTRTNLASALTALESALQALIALLGQVQ